MKKGKKKRARYARDVRELLSHFVLGGAKPKKGELVLIAEICRVVNPHYGAGEVTAINVLPACGTCKGEPCGHERVLDVSRKGGQQALMLLRRSI